MNTINAAVHAAFPVVPVPACGPLPPAQACGTRYLVGRDGLSRELSLPWIRVCELVAPSALALPYGRLEDAVEFRCGPLPDRVLREFTYHARRALPNEVAGALLWNGRADSWRYLERPTRASSEAHVRYEEVRPQQDEHLVVDLHSHGAFVNLQRMTVTPLRIDPQVWQRFGVRRDRGRAQCAQPRAVQRGQ